MPIKYNLTKHDILAENIRELLQKRDPFTRDEEIRRAEAIIIASICSSHSWQTNQIITEGNVTALLTSPHVRNEYTEAKNTKWKLVNNMNIQEVARLNINGMFHMWLNAINIDKPTKEIYKEAWTLLRSEFAAECDGISMSEHR